VDGRRNVAPISATVRTLPGENARVIVKLLMLTLKASSGTETGAIVAMAPVPCTVESNLPIAG
jgi:hypothetical protein